MFSLCLEPPRLHETDLYRVCPSLNAPVVNIDALPVGPVRAAIVLHAVAVAQGKPRVPQLTIGLRSLETGRVAVYQYSGQVRRLNSASRALDVALSFAETMGFLFDDDLVGDIAGPGRARALSLWQKLVGQDDASWDASDGMEGVIDAGELDPQAVELPPDPARGPANVDVPILDEGSEPAARVEPAEAAPVVSAAGLEAAGVSSPVVDDSAGDSSSPAQAEDDAAYELDLEYAGQSASTLGRVSLVRRRVTSDDSISQDDAGEGASRLLLLGSF